MQTTFDTIIWRLATVARIGVAVALGASHLWKWLATEAMPTVAATMTRPSVILPAGTRVKLGQEVAQVFGGDSYDCEGQVCKGLKLDEGTASKDVTLVVAGRVVQERWRFFARQDMRFAVRPSGQYVLAVK